MFAWLKTTYANWQKARKKRADDAYWARVADDTAEMAWERDS